MPGRDDETLPDADLEPNREPEEVVVEDPHEFADVGRPAEVDDVETASDGPVRVDLVKHDGPDAAVRVDLVKHDGTHPAGAADDLDDALDDDTLDDDDLGAPDDDDAPNRSSTLVLGGVVLALVVLLGALFVVTREPTVPAFTVFDEPTTREELATELTDLLAPEVVDSIGSEDATTEQRAAIAQGITSLITTQVLEGAAADADVTVTDEELDAAIEDLVETTFAGDPAAFEAALETQQTTEDAIRDQLRSTLLAEALVDLEIEPVDPATVRETYDLQFNVPTVAHILVATEEEARAARDRIEGGEDFAAVATEVSTDQSAAGGGELGPFQPGQFMPAFEEAALALEPGEVSEPVQTEFGFHLIRTGEPLSFEEVEAPLTAQLEEQNVSATFAELLAREEEAAMITVDPVFGEWAGITQGGVIPPGLDTELQDPAQLPPPTAGS